MIHRETINAVITVVNTIRGKVRVYVRKVAWKGVIKVKGRILEGSPGYGIKDETRYVQMTTVTYRPINEYTCDGGF